MPGPLSRKCKLLIRPSVRIHQNLCDKKIINSTPRKEGMMLMSAFWTRPPTNPVSLLVSCLVVSWWVEAFEPVCSRPRFFQPS